MERAPAKVGALFLVSMSVPSQQKLIAEGLNYIFAKHSKPKIAEQ